MILVITAMKTERGLALQDLLTGAYDYIETLELKAHARIYLLDYLATAEFVTSLLTLLFNSPTLDTGSQRAPARKYSSQRCSVHLRMPSSSLRGSGSTKIQCILY